MTEAEEDIIGCVDMLDGSIEVGEGWTLIDVGEAEALKDVAFIEMVADAFWEVLDLMRAELGGILDALIDIEAKILLLLVIAALSEAGVLLVTTLIKLSDMIWDILSVADICTFELNTDDGWTADADVVLLSAT